MEDVTTSLDTAASDAFKTLKADYESDDSERHNRAVDKMNKYLELYRISEMPGWEVFKETVRDTHEYLTQVLTMREVPEDKLVFANRALSGIDIVVFKIRLRARIGSFIVKAYPHGVVR